MALTLPRLDDRTWDDLVEEARLLLPAYAPGWTNHNAADPGITLIELLAYFSEVFLYRIDQISEANTNAFLKLINGPGWQPVGDIRQDTRKTLAGLRGCPSRAVTAEDFEALALSANHYLADDAPARVARAKCLPRRDLQATSSKARLADAPGHVSLVVVPEPLDAETGPLLRVVQRVVEPARLVATRVHVVTLPHPLVGVRLSLIATGNALPAAVQKAAVQALTSFLHPLTGGPDGAGWPFGRNVYVSEIYQLLAGVPGVKSLGRLVDPKTGKPQEELVLRSHHQNRLRYNRHGELEAIELQPSELVTLGMLDDDLTVVSEGRLRPAQKQEHAL